ncbi:conserved hypothetical protein [Neisseria gonorrhoeae DGI2]|uniref:Uncharacterized protein n=1 Tax=Neisseria gonorrhoeae (strain NCCP11945) TaxID=521006 RepID=B4RIU9_NEIG2|nr:Conserved hypothetical protein [Neisseria gonorrhoeae NCCP11945]EEZ49481.1 predicted protein [Neisseria gonorrhoeae PID18]EEZ54141.1 predicted protein [Neisseria gonorrhoeae PID332]EEZ58613.1 predicted protein [Neisseria gonorrhoeae SK-93-1035]EFE03403.1 conserved hypothetical protein [Neisseria gonorrhoeae DGI2]EFF40664.1 hypothetical protein NGNG_00633 [Neisseria gonorrhoeae F62]
MSKRGNRNLLSEGGTLVPPFRFQTAYGGLNSNRYSLASPCLTICTVCGFVALS